jgi:diguanylate cyclase (GGDEF)-like protein
MGTHHVQFYEDDIFLVTGLVDYIGSALDGGHKGIAIATRTHLTGLEQTLKARGLLDASGRATKGDYVALEVDHVLPLIMDDGMPNEARFLELVGNIVLEAAAEGAREIFIFGEMIAILCCGNRCPLDSAAKHEAALHIERYFNNLLRRYRFSLLCGYPLSAFPSAQDRSVFDEICSLHTDVFPAESYDPNACVATLQRTVASLQQQAYSLAAEVHDRRQVEQALREVNFDRLTGLPNRSVFHDRLEMDIKKAHRSGLPLALLFIDLDHFKEINDTMGHDTGDMLLRQVAQRLKTYVRESDTVARLGGDEFTITLSDLHDIDTVTDVAQKICDDLAHPFRLGNELAYISASIGITMYPRDAHSAGELLRNADQAMYRSKDQGRNRFSYFTRSMQESAQSRMALSNELRRALDEHQLEVYYQPIVDMASGRIRKAEALLRWRHPERGEISPDDFIPIAEHNGMIVNIGNWTFRQALQQAQRWRSYDGQLTVNVNVSPAQFYHCEGNLYSDWVCGSALASVGDAAGIPAIGVEITEGMLLASNSSVARQLAALQKTGITISLDDFGTGYSSLSYLRKFHIDFLKIDKSFVYNLEHDAANVALCEAIIVMAHKLGLKVIAEGVETAQQRDLLRSAGCDFAQGFLFSMPLPAAQFEALLLQTVAAPS